MFHHGWQRHAHRLRQLADGGAFRLREALQNCSSRRADKRAENMIQTIAMVHHLVNYRLLRLWVSSWEENRIKLRSAFHVTTGTVKSNLNYQAVHRSAAF